MKVTRDELEQFFSSLLSPEKYKDYGPNGLQVEGIDTISNIAFAVSATLDSIQISIAHQADALVVHHGLLWDFHGVRPLTGPFGKRIQSLIRNQINLFGYHLPLDGHPELGNAACIAQELGMQELAPFGDYKGMPTGIQGRLPFPALPYELKIVFEQILHHPVFISTPNHDQPISTLGIITGGANSGWKDAAQAGLDAYITGEMSEHDWNDAKEAGIHMFAGGHHATEVFGIKRLMEEVQSHFQIPCFFINSENPA